MILTRFVVNSQANLILQNDLEEPEWGSEDEDELEGDSEAEGEEDDGGVGFSREAGN